MTSDKVLVPRSIWNLSAVFVALLALLVCSGCGQATSRQGAPDRVPAVAQVAAEQHAEVAQLSSDAEPAAAQPAPTPQPFLLAEKRPKPYRPRGPPGQTFLPMLPAPLIVLLDVLMPREWTVVERVVCGQQVVAWVAINPVGWRVGAVQAVGFRYYDATVGRYVSRDPIGYGDGMNVYRYVGNNPVNFIDPLGLKLEVRGDKEKQALEDERKTLAELTAKQAEMGDKKDAGLDREVARAQRAVRSAEGDWNKHKEFNERAWSQIEKIKESSSIGREIIAALENSKDTYLITNRTNPEGAKNSVYDETSKTIYLHSDSKREQGLLNNWGQPAESILVHEMTHAFDDMRGDLMTYMAVQKSVAGTMRTEYKHATKPGMTKDIALSLLEARAVMVQNQVSLDLGAQAAGRTEYSRGHTYPQALLSARLQSVTNLDTILPPRANP